MLSILAPRQQIALEKMMDILKHPFKRGCTVKKLLTTLLVLVECFNCVLFDTPVSPDGQLLNLDGYSLVFEDEFEGDSLDLEKWFYRGDYSEGAGHYAPSQVKVENGNLILTGEYRKDGSRGEGWYSGEIALREKFCRGYFECTCICSNSKEYWSAFWIQADHPYDHELSQGGIYGAELDIFEAFGADYLLPWNRDGVKTTIHCNGYDENPEKIDSFSIGEFKGKDIYTRYNTYGMEWTEDEYIFYINGVETGRTSFGKGVSTVPETVLLSLCMPQTITESQEYTTQFVVDSVRIYQK